MSQIHSTSGYRQSRKGENLQRVLGRRRIVDIQSILGRTEDDIIESRHGELVCKSSVACGVSGHSGIAAPVDVGCDRQADNRSIVEHVVGLNCPRHCISSVGLEGRVDRY